MVFGLLKDIKNGEYRTIATPGEIETIVADGHTALVQRGAGDKAGFADEAYVKAGAQLADGQGEFVAAVSSLEDAAAWAISVGARPTAPEELVAAWRKQLEGVVRNG